MKFPRLSSDLLGKKDGISCQRCGTKEATERWEECDDADKPEGIFVILCSPCSGAIIRPHARLYRKVLPLSGNAGSGRTSVKSLPPLKKDYGVAIYFASVFALLLWGTTRGSMGLGLSVVISAFLTLMGGSLLFGVGAWISTQLFGGHEGWPRLLVGMSLAIGVLIVASYIMPRGCGFSGDYDPSEHYRRP